MAPITTAILFIYIIAHLVSVYADGHRGDCSECGLGPSKPVFKMMNKLIKPGIPVNDTKRFPWLVSFRVTSDSNHCAGAILDEHIILTAAHCVNRTGNEDGYKNLKVYFQTASEEQMSKGPTIEKAVVHPKYKLTPSNATNILFAEYDIALIKLEKKIKCDDYKRPICLPSPQLKIPFGKEIHIAGWGDSDIGRRPPKLNHGTLKRINFEECIKAVPETKMIRDHMLCLGGTKHTVCYGDSGGPLIDRIDSKYTVVGIASSETDTKCKTTSPVIYTNVAKFVNWIKEQQRKLQKPSLLRGKNQVKRGRNHRRRFRKKTCNRNKPKKCSWKSK